MTIDPLDPATFAKALAAMTDAERAEVDSLLASDPVPWRPQVGPQSAALESEADILGFGGSAGGGKSDLAIGLSTTRHQRVGIFRRFGTELSAIIDRIAQVLGSRDGFNARDNCWRFNRYDGVPAVIEFGSFPLVGDEAKYRGRPHDLLVFDEAQAMAEGQVRFLLAWLRSTDPQQRCRAVLTFNPPSDPEGRWLLRFFGPWLNPEHPNPAKPGELRWFATVDGQDVERPNGAPFQHKGETIRPTSRTFIPSRLRDNAYLSSTGYEATLQSLPEPLRSQLLYGDFQAGLQDSEYQVIPSAWVAAAMDRWRPLTEPTPMDSLGCDPARGGQDNTVLIARHAYWFGHALVHPGTTTPDGPSVARLCTAAARDFAPIHVDAIGVGAAVVDALRAVDAHCVAVNVARSATAGDRSGVMLFANLRAQLLWRVRELLDPANGCNAQLPPDERLREELAAFTWKPVGGKIAVASRDDIIGRIGRSPDRASALALALISTFKRSDRWRREAEWDQGLAARNVANRRRERDPFDVAAMVARHDPIAGAMREMSAREGKR